MIFTRQMKLMWSQSFTIKSKKLPTNISMKYANYSYSRDMRDLKKKAKWMTAWPFYHQTLRTGTPKGTSQ